MEFRPNGTLNDTELIVPYPEDERFRSALKGDEPNASLINELNASLSTVETERGEMLRLNIGDFTPQTQFQRFEPPKEIKRRVENGSEERKVIGRNITGTSRYSSYDLVVKIKYNRSLDQSDRKRKSGQGN